MLGIGNYYLFDSNEVMKIGDYSDLTYYYLNSKYFEELGYFELYPAMLLADEEDGHFLDHVSKYRDLHTYVKTSRKFAQLSDVKKKFTVERWQQFKDDVKFFVSHDNSGGWKYFFSDHGFNPPPTWTIIGRILSRSTPITHLKLITSLDILLVVIMFCFVAWSFGVDTMLFSILFFCVTFSGRWPVLGHALLRFDWLVAIVVAVCMLKKNYFFVAGGLVMYAALNRIFPVLFFFPVLFHLLLCVYRHGNIDNTTKSFIKGSGCVFILLVVTSVIVHWFRNSPSLNIPVLSRFAGNGSYLSVHAKKQICIA